jgi:hypothetical protein
LTQIFSVPVQKIKYFQPKKVRQLIFSLLFFAGSRMGKNPDFNIPDPQHFSLVKQGSLIIERLIMFLLTGALWMVGREDAVSWIQAGVAL